MTSMFDDAPLNEEELSIRLRGASKETIFQLAYDVVEDRTKESVLFDATVDDRIPRFERIELKLGRNLGRGGFCMVHEIESVNIDGSKKGGSSIGSNPLVSFFRREERNDGELLEVLENGSNCGSEFQQRIFSSSKRSTISVDIHSRGGLAAFSNRRRRKGGLFAFKQVLPVAAGATRVDYLKGLVDLAMEAKFLATLDHPSIIKICGMSCNGPADFIIVQRLRETLTSKFRHWMKIDRQCKGITGVFTGSKKKEKELYQNRIKAAYDIASAMEYLHGRNIVYRDLKPDNCGFDMNGNLQIFDFGLAKELKEDMKTANGLYKLTAMTGAMRYMAPEVGLGQDYNLSVDVYSWSMIMWFILALEPPFGFYTEDMIRDRVFMRGSRPAIFDAWSEDLAGTLKRGWDANIESRPTFSEIRSTLRAALKNQDTDTMTASSTASTLP